MREQLEDVLEKIIELLTVCGLERHTSWFQDRLERVRDCHGELSELRCVASEIEPVIAGMGSFSDLSLQQPAMSGLTDREADRIKTLLAHALNDVVWEILEE